MDGNVHKKGRIISDPNFVVWGSDIDCPYTHTLWTFKPSSEAPRAQRGASRKGDFFYIVPLDPAYKAGLAGHLPVKLAKGLILSFRRYRTP